MKKSRRHVSWIQNLIRLVIFCLTIILFISPAYAIMPVPDIGVDYQTMQVKDPARLEKAGMEQVRKGDPVDVQVSRDGQVTVINKRTGQTVILSVEE